MTLTVIVLSVTVWVLLSAFFVTAACVLSARLRQANSAGDDTAVSPWTPGEGEMPTKPITS